MFVEKPQNPKTRKLVIYIVTQKYRFRNFILRNKKVFQTNFGFRFKVF